MYHKIAQISLNSGQSSGLSEVYVAQPDAIKENLAGKIFILAEIGGRKSDGRKLLDFLVESLSDNYYDDEKLALKDKIEGLRVENIFEAALAKTNKSLLEFISEEKIRLNPAATNITLGVIYENRLHFSNFGKNRALLIYHRANQYEVINVEANAADDSGPTSKGEAGSLFSSVISGEIPVGSYFVFTSEALPEYLSGREMVNIITKLPPIVAAEQIKNVLSKINAYVPFLGILIKNTVGLPIDVREEAAEAASAQASISSLNSTEAKTEQMLAPAGLVNFPKILKGVKETLGRLRPEIKPLAWRRPETELSSLPQADTNLGRINSLNMPRAESFLTQEKIFFRKEPGWAWHKGKRLLIALAAPFNPHFWSNLWSGLKAWVASLSPRNRWLLVGLGLAVFILLSSLLISTGSQKRQTAREEFSALVSQIEDKESLIDSHLLYSDDLGARSLLAEAETLLASLPQAKKYQVEDYARLDERLAQLREKVYKLKAVSQASEYSDLSGLGIKSLAFSSGSLYGLGGQRIYAISQGAPPANTWEPSGANQLSRPYAAGDIIYALDGQKLVSLNTKTGASSIPSVSNFESGVTSFHIFGSHLYLLAGSQNQIYKHNNISGASSAWIKQPEDLSQARDLYIDGSIYVLKADGSLLKFYTGNVQEYQAPALLPAMDDASRLIGSDKYLYIFSPGSKRLAVLAKQDGHLISQYRFDSLSQMDDIVLSDDGKTAYILSGEKVYQANLD